MAIFNFGDQALNLMQLKARRDFERQQRGLDRAAAEKRIQQQGAIDTALQDARLTSQENIAGEQLAYQYNALKQRGQQWKQQFGLNKYNAFTNRLGLEGQLSLGKKNYELNRNKWLFNKGLIEQQNKNDANLLNLVYNLQNDAHTNPAILSANSPAVTRQINDAARNVGSFYGPVGAAAAFGSWLFSDPQDIADQMNASNLGMAQTSAGATLLNAAHKNPAMARSALQLYLQLLGGYQGQQLFNPYRMPRALDGMNLGVQ